jgi:hypothetical protein
MTSNSASCRDETLTEKRVLAPPRLDGGHAVSEPGRDDGIRLGRLGKSALLQVAVWTRVFQIMHVKCPPRLLSRIGGECHSRIAESIFEGREMFGLRRSLPGPEHGRHFASLRTGSAVCALVKTAGLNKDYYVVRYCYHST